LETEEGIIPLSFSGRGGGGDVKHTVLSEGVATAEMNIAHHLLTWFQFSLLNTHARVTA